MKLKCNCCDGIYNSLDVHFTSACDNKCSHCIDNCYDGLGINKPDVNAILETIYTNCEGVDDVLFLGGEPCLYLDELLYCVKQIKSKTSLKVYVTTAVPKICHDQYGKFVELIEWLDGINLSVQHYKEDVADEIRQTKSQYDRQTFYASLPLKNKIRINLNIVKPFLYTKEDIISCLCHYDKMGVNSIKLSEIQHGADCYVSFEKVFNLKMKSPFSFGCQTYLDMSTIIPDFTTSILLKRSCFICEETLHAAFSDGLKALLQVFIKPKNKYGIIYEDGTLTKEWI